MTYLDLRRVRLRPGEELSDSQEVEIAPIELGGQRYVAVPEKVSADLTVTRTTSGMFFRLRLDSIVLALPDKILCREDCAGLCPVCGRNLNREPHGHEGEESDPRWAALAELRESL
jgi:uncharacterized protein